MKIVNIVGGGLTGCTLAYLLKKKGYSVTIFEKDKRIGGLCKDNKVAGLIHNPHGPHIFHTNIEKAAQFMTERLQMRPYVHRVLSFYENRFYPYPPNEAMMKAENWTRNDIYERFIRNYTEKMWGRKIEELGKDITGRIRINKGNLDTFFLDKYQGHPVKGYDPLFKSLTEGIKIIYGKTITAKDKLKGDLLIVTSPLDEYFENAYGKLEWRGMRTEIVLCHQPSFQPVASVNYPEKKFPYLRITEFKKLSGQNHPWTAIAIDYPDKNTKFYPVDRQENMTKVGLYKAAAKKRNVILAGRLGTYKYINMDQAILMAMKLAEEL
ncbi:hypothetical protein CL633_02410 [bacterium]|nr:hypothetical protein [bacterium]|tara:strand:- start:4077 stop:5045 length:969 start_codon:yes stop_codon:yes gene_type:complete